MGAAEKEDPILAVVAAMIAGDRWLAADAAAVYMGQMPRQTFVQLSARPGFPVATWLGKRRVWKKSELDAYVERERVRQQRQRAA